MSHQPTEQSFLKDVAEHKMIVKRDDGVYRHVRFINPKSSSMFFDLITYPGYLVYSGDMGCYVFQRLEDMFQFFRTDREHLHQGRKLGINLGYWSEKLQAVDGNRHQASATEFSEERFRRAIMEYLVSWIRDNATSTTKEERRELWDEVVSDVLGANGDSGGFRMQAAAHDFYHVTSERVTFQFDDLFDHDFTEYTYRFIWCCYALAWGGDAVRQRERGKRGGGMTPAQRVQKILDESVGSDLSSFEKHEFLPNIKRFHILSVNQEKVLRGIERRVFNESEE